MTKIKNNTGSHQIWLGQLITSGQYFTIPEDQSHKWAYDDELLEDIASGIALVNNGVSDFTDATSGINFLQSIDADYIKGVLVDDSSKGDAKVLCYSLAGDKIQYDDISTLSVFGTEFQQVESESTSSTTSQTFQQKLRLTTASLPLGNYRIGWSYEIKGSGSARARVQLNDTTDLGESAFDGSIPDYGDFGGFYYASNISGVQNIDIDYKAYAGTGYIRRARIEIWRTS